MASTVNPSQHRRHLLDALRKAGNRLVELATEEERGDREVVEAAVGSEPGALRYASGELRFDHRLVALAIHGKRHRLRWIGVGEGYTLENHPHMSIYGNNH